MKEGVMNRKKDNSHLISRILFLSLAMFIFLIMFVPARQTYAAAAQVVELQNVKKGGTIVLSDGAGDKKTEFEVQVKDVFEKATITSVTRSKKGIVNINLKGGTYYSSEPRYTQGCFAIKPLKAGTVTLTVKGKKAGKAFSFKLIVKVLKYQSPFKSFTLKLTKSSGKTSTVNMKSKLNGTVNRFEYYNVSKAKFSLSLNTNWSLLSNKKDFEGNEFIGKIPVTGKTFTLKDHYDENDEEWYEDWQVLGLVAKNKKTGQIVSLRVDLHSQLGGD